ncbi:DUF262 domain-containing protein [Helicobacter cetorum]|uniref:DUF262 domain-containing protein n=1 Tax=Helicobacter cetorum TaxID=138563 RepID=UPI00131579FA|nr:DUF262 domain-containing protein [Helicobacter cetorum]
MLDNKETPKEEKDKELEGEDKNDYTDYSNSKANIKQEQYSIRDLKTYYDEETQKEYKDRLLRLDPEFQRGGDIWELDQKSQLIESVLMGIPIPIFYFFENEYGQQDVIDGRQRLGTFFAFMDNEFELVELNILKDLNNKKFQDLEPILRTKIQRYQLLVYVIQPPTPPRIKYDIFDRVNRGGTQLSGQEIRNALYQGESTKLLDLLANDKNFKNALGSFNNKRMKDKNMILRFLGFYLLYNDKMEYEYRSDMDEFLVEVMKYLNRQNDSVLNSLKEMFRITMKNVYAILGNSAFRFNSKERIRPINVSLFEAISYLFTLLNEKMLQQKNLKEKIERLKENMDKTGYFKSGTSGYASVSYRFNEVLKFKKSLEND